MKVLIFDGYTDNLFRIFFNHDSRLNVKTHYQQREDSDGSQIYNEKDWDILVMSLFDVDNHFSQENSTENIKNMKRLINNSNSQFKIFIDGLGEGCDIGRRWGQLFDFCDNLDIDPNTINLFLTTMNVEESYNEWKKSDTLRNLKVAKNFIYNEKIPFKWYDNDFLSFVYFSVNRFINKDNKITTMGGEYNKLYEKDGLFLKPNRQLRDYKILSLVANPMTHRVIVQNHLLKNQYDKQGLISFNDNLQNIVNSRGQKIDHVVCDTRVLKEFNLLEYFNKEFLNRIPIRIDWEEFNNSQSFDGRYSPNYDFYNNSYFSVVCETNYEMEFDNDTYSYHLPIFLTEKTLNALWSYHPFIIVNHKHSLKKLRELGFETFPELFDESYDEEFDPQKRLKMVLSEIDRVMKLDKKELHKIYWSMEDKFIHNRNVILDIVLNQTPNVYEDLNKILGIGDTV
jgi:hypothetical protein